MTIIVKPGAKRPVLGDITHLSAFGAGALKRLKQKRDRRERAAAWLLHLETEHEKRMAELNRQLEEAQAVEWQAEEVADDPEQHTRMYLRVRNLAPAVPQGELLLWANDVCWRAGIGDLERRHYTDEYMFVKAVNCAATTIQRTWRQHRHVKRMKEERLRFVRFVNAIGKGSWTWGSLPDSDTNILPLLAAIADVKTSPRTAREKELDDSELTRQQAWNRKWEKFSGTRSVSLPSRLRDDHVELPSLTTAKSMSGSSGQKPSKLMLKEMENKKERGVMETGKMQGVNAWSQALNDLNINPKSSVVGLGNYNSPTQTPTQSPRKSAAPSILPKLHPPASTSNPMPRKKSTDKKKPQHAGRQLLNPVIF